MRYLIASFISCMLCALAIAEKQTLQVSPLFGENMILQANKEFSVFGKGEPNTQVKVVINTEDSICQQKTTVDQTGFWSIQFKPLKQNLNGNIKISNNEEKIIIDHFQTGDVWLIIGGSNTLQKIGNEIHFSNIRKQCPPTSPFNYLMIPKGSAFTAQNNLDKTNWKPCTTDHLPEIPSVAYHFGNYLSKGIQTPLGIINCGFGGSAIETWMSAEDMGMTGEQLKEKLSDIKSRHHEQMIEEVVKKIPYTVRTNQFEMHKDQYASAQVNDKNWEETLVPETFESKNLTAFDGVVWFRKKIIVPEQVEMDKISVGFVDDSDEVYINGRFVGGVKDGYGIRRIYDIPKGLIHPGTNTIAIRVHDFGGGGGLYGSPELYYLSGGNIKIDISGNWKHRITTVQTDLQMNDIQRPGMLYNQMLHPLRLFPIKGVIWYQGEYEGTSDCDLDLYKTRMEKLIKGFEKRYQDPLLPFLIVQLPSYGEKNDNQNQKWADFRFLQSDIAKQFKHVNIIPTIDLINKSKFNDIHLKNHQKTGTRLAKTALKNVYLKRSEVSCATFKKCELKDQFLILYFSDAQKLKIKDEYGYIRGFELSTGDGRFHKAQAEVFDGNKIKVWHPKMITPKLVRYAAAANAREANVFNEAGIPLLPFDCEL